MSKHKSLSPDMSNVHQRNKLYDEIMSECEPLVKRTVANVVSRYHTKVDAEDVLQQVRLELLNNVNQIIAARKLKSYVYVAVKNAAFRAVQKELENRRKSLGSENQEFNIV